MEVLTGIATEGVSTAFFETEDEWLTSQRKGITSPEAAAVLRESPAGDPLTVFQQKLGLYPAPEPDAATEWAHRLTPAIAEKFAEVTKHELYDLGKHTTTVNDNWPCSRTTIDRLIVTYPTRRGALSIKTGTASEGTAKQWAAYCLREYWIEVQHMMAVANLEFGALAMLLGGDHFLWHEIDRDEAFIQSMMADLEEFWHGHVVAEKAPEGRAAHATNKDWPASQRLPHGL